MEGARPTYSEGMAPTPDPRRVAAFTGAAVGTVVALGAGAVGVLGAQALRTRRIVGPLRSVAPYADGRYGPRSGTSYRLVVLGDSSAAGLGVSDPGQTGGALLATGLANLTDRGVVLATMAVVGAESRHLAAQVERALVLRPHVVVIMIGANDVTHLRGRREPVRELVAQIVRLRAEGVEVVVGTCPDLGTVTPMAQPLRGAARRLSRSLAEAQGKAAAAAGARVVPLAALLGREFGLHPDHFFSADRFHPSGHGYAAAAAAILPSVLLAVDKPELLAQLMIDEGDDESGQLQLR